MANERNIDQELVRRAQQGEKLAFDALVSKYQRKVYRIALRLMGDPADAEDVVQETFIKAYRALPQFRGESAFYTWLYRIAINAARNALELRGRHFPQTGSATPEDDETFGPESYLSNADTPESLLSGKQLAQVINQAMEDLPADWRLALSLREIDGMTYEDIAKAMACPIGTVRSRIFRAREAIAEKIGQMLKTGFEKR